MMLIMVIHRFYILLGSKPNAYEELLFTLEMLKFHISTARIQTLSLLVLNSIIQQQNELGPCGKISLYSYASFINLCPNTVEVDRKRGEMTLFTFIIKV